MWIGGRKCGSMAHSPSAKRNGLPAKCDANHHGNRSPDLQGADTNEKGISGPRPLLVVDTLLVGHPFGFRACNECIGWPQVPGPVLPRRFRRILIALIFSLDNDKDGNRAVQWESLMRESATLIWLAAETV